MSSRTSSTSWATTAPPPKTLRPSWRRVSNTTATTAFLVRGFTSKHEVVAQSYNRGAILRAIIRVQRSRVQVAIKLSGADIWSGRGSNEAWQRLEEKDVLLEVPESKDSHYEIVLKPAFGGSVGVDSVVKTPATMIVHLENVTPYLLYLLPAVFSCIFCRRRAGFSPVSSAGGERRRRGFSPVSSAGGERRGLPDGV